MPVISYDRLARALEGGERGGVYFFVGDEEYLKEEAAKRVIEAHLDPATRDFNLDQLRGHELEPATLASILQTPPMLAEWRVVVIREAQALAGAPRLRGTVEGLLDRPTPGLAVLLLAQIPDGSKAQFYDRVKKQALTVEFNALAPADVPGWLMERAATEGLELEPRAAQALAAALGTDMGVLAREISKLRDYVGERARATLEDVRAVSGRIPHQNRWEWFDMVGQRRWRQAREGLPTLLDAGETGVGLVLGLGTHFLRLALVAAGGAAALENELPPRQRWLASRVARQARGWTAQALERALEDLLRADRLLKSTALDDEQVLLELLLRLEARAGSTPQAPPPRRHAPT